MADRAVNQTSEAIIICLTPDVCKTPLGASLVPVPYPIIAKFDAAKATSQKTNFEGNPVFHMGSFLPQVQGDEAGVGGGIVSGVNIGCCKPIQHSSTLKTEGEWVVRHGDLMEMNCAGPKGTGNTKGKIIFIAMLKLSQVSPDGSIEYTEERTVTDANGNTTSEKIKVTRSADGSLQEASYSQVKQDSQGNVAGTSSDFKFDHEGKLSEANYETRSQPAPYDAEGQSVSEGQTFNELEYQPPENSLQRPEPDLAGDPEYQQAQRDMEAAEAEIQAIKKEQALDAAQLALDVAGMADPTPVSDVAGGIMSASRGDWMGAGLSVISIVPYLGDAVAKPMKAAKAAAKASKLAAKLKKASDKLKKAKEAAEAAAKKAKDRLKKKTSKVDDAVTRADDGGKIKGRKKTNHQKAAIGEKAAHDKMLKEGYEPVGKTDGVYRKGETGIDGIYKNKSPPPDYVITEAKYGTSRLGNTADGKQMSDPWIRNRLDKQVGSRIEADKIRKAMDAGRVDRIVLNVKPDGSVVQKTLDISGKVVSKKSI